MTPSQLLDELDRRQIPIGVGRDGRILLGRRAKIDHKLAGLLILHHDELKRLLVPPATPASVEMRKCCWKCGASAVPPSPAEQIASMRMIQRCQPENFSWNDSELARLENRMNPGDFLILIRADSVEAQRPDGSRYSHFRNDA